MPDADPLRALGLELNPANYADAYSTVQEQKELTQVGEGATSEVYGVDENIVLKARRIFEQPSEDASPRKKSTYAQEMVYHYNVLERERGMYRVLEKNPHPNIIEAIDTNHHEGLYLRRYHQVADFISAASQADRIHWYREIIHAVHHLHTLDIVHSDLRKDNIFFDPQGHALIGDFGASCIVPLGEKEPSGLTNVRTDRADVGSLIYELETGVEVDGQDVSQIQTGHSGLNSLIDKAWREQYTSTAEMLADARNLNDDQDPRRPMENAPTKADLATRVAQWRQKRQEQHGMSILTDECFCFNRIHQAVSLII